MRAVTGAIVSSKPCSLLKAKGILSGFYKSSASNLPSSDAATYLLTAADAVLELREFRRDLLRAQHQHQHEVKVDVEDGDLVHSRAAAGERKRRKKEEKRVKQEEDVVIQQEEEEEEEKSKEGVAVVSKVGISLVPRKKKKEKDIVVKQEAEEEVIGAEEEPKHKKKTVHALIGSEDKKRKHAAQEFVEVKKEEADFVDADLGSDKKKKKKRSRDGYDDNGNAAQEAEVEHTKKKQRK